MGDFTPPKYQKLIPSPFFLHPPPFLGHPPPSWDIQSSLRSHYLRFWLSLLPCAKTGHLPWRRCETKPSGLGRVQGPLVVPNVGNGQISSRPQTRPPKTPKWWFSSKGNGRILKVARPGEGSGYLGYSKTIALFTVALESLERTLPLCLNWQPGHSANG